MGMNISSLRYSGILLLIEEVIVTAKNLNIAIVLGKKDVNNHPVFQKDGWRHRIFRVTLTSQEQYAVDLTGAQYGYHEECLPWEDYVTARVDRIIEINHFGATEKWLAEDTPKCPYPASLVRSMSLSFFNEMEGCIKVWEGCQGSVSALLALPEEEYAAKKVSFLDFIKTYMNYAREECIRQGFWCRK